MPSTLNYNNLSALAVTIHHTLEQNRACGKSPMRFPAGRLSNTCRSEHSSTPHSVDRARKSPPLPLAHGAKPIPSQIQPVSRDDRHQALILASKLRNLPVDRLSSTLHSLTSGQWAMLQTRPNRNEHFPPNHLQQHAHENAS